MAAVRVIEWRFPPEDVARIRLAFSPVYELVFSLIVLRDPARHALHLPWIRWARPRLTGFDLSELFALVPVRGITADFLTPPPTSPLPDLAEELDTIRRTTPNQVIADLADVPDLSTEVSARIVTSPAAATHRLADTLHSYWELVFTPHWPRMRALLEADVLWRSRRLADGGAGLLFNDLHETIVWHGNRLTAEDRWSYSGDLSGEGLLLVPSLMAWPTVRKMVRPYQPTLIYPARAIATLWETGHPAAGTALATLLGRSRAALLTALAEPATTTALAQRLNLTPGGVSQHLSVLFNNGLVTRARVGSTVLYRRTSRGDNLVHD